MFQGRKKISLKFLKMDNLFAQYVIQSVPEKTVPEGTLDWHISLRQAKVGNVTFVTNSTRTNYH